jgi:hypothetical protein
VLHVYPEMSVCYLLSSARRGKPGCGIAESAMNNLRAAKVMAVCHKKRGKNMWIVVLSEHGELEGRILSYHKKYSHQ